MRKCSIDRGSRRRKSTSTTSDESTPVPISYTDLGASPSSTEGHDPSVSRCSGGRRVMICVRLLTWRRPKVSQSAPRAECAARRGGRAFDRGFGGDLCFDLRAKRASEAGQGEGETLSVRCGHLRISVMIGHFSRSFDFPSLIGKVERSKGYTSSCHVDDTIPIPPNISHSSIRPVRRYSQVVASSSQSGLLALCQLPAGSTTTPR